MSTTDDRLDCRGGVHSQDRVAVYTGHPEPRIMCGFHAQQQQASTTTTKGTTTMSTTDTQNERTLTPSEIEQGQRVRITYKANYRLRPAEVTVGLKSSGELIGVLDGNGVEDGANKIIFGYGDTDAFAHVIESVTLLPQPTPAKYTEGDRVTFTYLGRHYDTTLVADGRSLRAADIVDGLKPYVIDPSGDVSPGIEGLTKVTVWVPVEAGDLSAGDRVRFTFNGRDVESTLVAEGDALRSFGDLVGSPYVVGEDGTFALFIGNVTRRKSDGAREKSEHEREIEALRSRAEEAERRLTEARNLHRSDIQTIGNRLMEEAEERDWCSEYDDVVDGLNRELSVELPKRQIDVSFEVTVTYQVTATAARSLSEGQALDNYFIERSVQAEYPEMDNDWIEATFYQTDIHVSDVERTD